MPEGRSAGHASVSTRETPPSATLVQPTLTGEVCMSFREGPRDWIETAERYRGEKIGVPDADL